MSSERARVADRVLPALVGLLTVFAALAMGGVAPWARGAIFVAAVGILAVWMVGRAASGRLEVERHPVWLFVLAFFGLAFLQLVPLPHSVLAFVQPGTIAAYAGASPGDPEQTAARELSLCRSATSAELLRLGALALVFFAVLQAARTRGRILMLVGVLLALGSFEALYGFFERFSGRPTIFGFPHPYAGDAVCGTFLNKNHFAGLLEMIVPLGLGLVFALRSPRWPAPAPRAGLRHLKVALATSLSSPRFVARAAVAALAVVMAVAVLLSLSRAGVLALAVGFGLLVALAMTRAGCRRHTVVAAGFALLVLAVTAGVGMSVVVDRLEDAASGRSAQWADRVDLSRSALPYVRDFPVLGSGLGTFGTVFPRYQSERFGDRWANYLHNDWLQLFCETGVLGGLALLAGLAVFLVSIARRMRRQRADSAWWIAAGALAGVAAMLVHSLFDYNLSRITSNGLVFCVLLALAYRAAGLEGREEREPPALRLPFGRLPLRLAWSALGLALVAGAAWLTVGPARADVSFNRYRIAAGAERTEDYFFLDVVAPAAFTAPTVDPAEPLARAHDLAPGNPTYAFHLGLAALAEADERVRERAVASARAVLGSLGAPSEQAVAKLAESLLWTLRTAMRDERRPFLERARARLGEAIALAPTNAEYHAVLAGVEQELGPGPTSGVRSIETALTLAPHKPSILHRAGLFFLARAPVDGRGVADPARQTLVLRCFRRAIAGDSAYAGRIYAVMRTVYGDAAPLLEVTPPTVPACGNLLAALWDAGDWAHAERCLDRLESLAGDDPGTRLTVTRHRTELFAMQGRWEDHRRAVEQHHRCLRERLVPAVAAADALRSGGRRPEAKQKLLAVLARDWSNPAARVAAAELASLPRVSALLSSGEGPLDHVLQLVLHVASWPEPLRERVLRILHMEDPRDPESARRLSLLLAAADLRSGRTRTGLDALRRLVASEEPRSPRSGPLDALAWFLVAEAEERSDRREPAIDAYRRILEIVPDHRDALAALVRLGDAGLRPQLEELAPDVPLHATFGGRVRLLGYRLWSGSAEAGAGAGLACYWQLLAGFESRFRPSIHLLDASRRKILAADHPFATSAGPYPVEAPRIGEVIVTVVPLAADPSDAHYIAVGVVAPGGRDAAPAVLRPDWGGDYVIGALRRTTRPIAARFRAASP
jgi:O-antigen ligase/tetratricopeptide (TPR) repeat protein